MLSNNANDEIKTNQKVTLLVGVSCSGKSTYLNKQKPCFIVSSDTIVKEICSENEITYAQFFQLPMSHSIRKEQRNRFNELVNESKTYSHITWDLTNLTASERKRAMSNYPLARFKAIVFEFRGYELKLIALNERRNSMGEKYVPEIVLLNMISKFEPIKKNEGFSIVESVNQIVNIPLLHNL
jgi:predicted kinase